MNWRRHGPLPHKDLVGPETVYGCIRELNENGLATGCVLVNPLAEFLLFKGGYPVSARLFTTQPCTTLHTPHTPHTHRTHPTHTPRTPKRTPHAHTAAASDK
jgi:hypothetical protein